MTLLLLAPSAAAAQAEPTGAVEVRGSMSVEIVRRVILRGAGRPLRHCWQEARGRRPGAGGRLVLRFVIDAAGAVPSVETASNELDEPLARCASDALRRLSFPSAPGVNVVTLPILFLPRPPRPRDPRDAIPRVATRSRGPIVVLP